MKARLLKSLLKGMCSDVYTLDDKNAAILFDYEPGATNKIIDYINFSCHDRYGYSAGGSYRPHNQKKYQLCQAKLSELSKSGELRDIMQGVDDMPDTAIKIYSIKDGQLIVSKTEKFPETDIVRYDYISAEGYVVTKSEWFLTPMEAIQNAIFQVEKEAETITAMINKANKIIGEATPRLIANSAMALTLLALKRKTLS